MQKCFFSHFQMFSQTSLLVIPYHIMTSYKKYPFPCSALLFLCREWRFGGALNRNRGNMGPLRLYFLCLFEV